MCLVKVFSWSFLEGQVSPIWDAIAPLWAPSHTPHLHKLLSWLRLWGSEHPYKKGKDGYTGPGLKWGREASLPHFDSVFWIVARICWWSQSMSCLSQASALTSFVSAWYRVKHLVNNNDLDCARRSNWEYWSCPGSVSLQTLGRVGVLVRLVFCRASLCSEVASAP